MDDKYMQPNVLEQILDGNMKPTDLRLALLENITDNFSEERQIGEGGFGMVYKGVVRNGNVAVKKIMSTHTIDEKLFRREVTSLMKVNHQNAVRFLGFCSNTEHKAIQISGSGEYIFAEIRERLLCFEYISNGGLDKYITDELRGLEWNTRYSIIKGICEGLHHLHRENGIIHMDLKPANILLDDQMIPKITDFGLSRLEENSQTMSTHRFLSLGYCAPEYQFDGKMSFKSDMYSLGVIIIELVTGQKGIPDNKNDVLRRWRHRWRKSTNEKTLWYQQVNKCIDIGIMCQAKNPYGRPFIWEVIDDINKMESANVIICGAIESTPYQITPYSDDDMLGVEPLDLHFPCDHDNKISCSLNLTNETNAYIAFNVEMLSLLPYFTQPEKGIVPPKSKCSVDITLKPENKSPIDTKHPGIFIVRSTKVNDVLTYDDITKDIFVKQRDNVVDEVNLNVVFDAQLLPPCLCEEPVKDLSLEALTLLGTGNLKNLKPSDFPQLNAIGTGEMKSEVISASSESTEAHLNKMVNGTKLMVASDGIPEPRSALVEEHNDMYNSLDSSCL